MNIQDKAKTAVHLYFDGLSAKDAIQQVLNIDGDSVYDEVTGNTVCQDITNNMLSIPRLLSMGWIAF